jgi:hypothetical protein
MYIYLFLSFKTFFLCVKLLEAANHKQYNTTFIANILDFFLFIGFMTEDIHMQLSFNAFNWQGMLGT